MTANRQQMERDGDLAPYLLIEGYLKGGSMRKAEMWVSVAFVFLGIMVIADSIRLGFMWGMSGPESGFFPFYLGVGVVISSLLVLYNAYARYKKEGAGKPLMPPGAIKPILWVLIPSTGMVRDHGICRAPHRCGAVSGFLHARCREDRVGDDASRRHHLATVALCHV